MPTARPGTASTSSDTSVQSRHVALDAAMPTQPRTQASHRLRQGVQGLHGAMLQAAGRSRAEVPRPGRQPPRLLGESVYAATLWCRPHLSGDAAPAWSHHCHRVGLNVSSSVRSYSHSSRPLRKGRAASEATVPEWVLCRAGVGGRLTGPQDTAPFSSCFPMASGWPAGGGGMSTQP